MKYNLELNAYQLSKIVTGNRIGIYAGFCTSFNFAYNRIYNENTLKFPTIERDIRLGIGGKIVGQLQLKEKLFFNFGTNFFLVDMGFYREKICNPILPLRQQIVSKGFKFDLLRNQFYFPIGLTFRL